jgi:outer membrane biosynthesis protein TonB
VNIAVVVDENGRAYSVTGVNTPQNLGDYLQLTSALAVVKSWEFQPATKDGAPVRYRLLIPLRAVTMSTR